MEELESMLERLAEVQEKINVNAVFGEPQTVEGRTLIPVAEVVYGVGFGFGAGPADHYCTCGCDEDDLDHECGCGCGEEHECGCEPGEVHEPGCECDECMDEMEEAALGGGGGAGGWARPVAYIEIGPEGAHIQPIINEQRVALAGILLAAWSVGWIGLVLKTLFAPRR
jgi:uncharacterized spore protein YtfJ